MKKISIDDISAHLVETIEMLKNNSDANASENEKIDIEAAKTIAELGKVVIDGYKVKAQVLGVISRTENPTLTREMSEAAGLIQDQKLLS